MSRAAAPPDGPTSAATATSAPTPTNPAAADEALGKSSAAARDGVQYLVFVGISVDGFLARPDGALDFLPQDGGEDHGFAAMMASVDALLMGRKTYDTVLSFGAWPYGEKPVFVLSRGALRPAPVGAHVEHLCDAPDQVTRILAARGIRRVYLDGGVTVQGFLAAGLVDRLILTRVPVLIGQGLPLFGPLLADVRLRHEATRTFPSGLVQSEYTILR